MFSPVMLLMSCSGGREDSTLMRLSSSSFSGAMITREVVVATDGGESWAPIFACGTEVRLAPCRSTRKIAGNGAGDDLAFSSEMGGPIGP